MLQIYGHINTAIKKELSEEDQQMMHIDDLVRSAVVLSVAAMDLYFTDVFSEHFVSYIKRKKPNESMVKILEKAGLNVEQSLEMFSMKKPYRRIRTLIDAHFSRYVTQNFQKVDDLFVGYRIKSISRSAQTKLDRRNIVKRIEILIQRRHSIVHRGDLNEHNNVKPIDVKDVLGRIRDMNKFVVASDGIILSKIR
tara:strand:- start:50 stop:634 length:585 start_codon:yes stop_codon:yes gene_type:complete